VKRVVLDTQRRRALMADSLLEEGDKYLLLLNGKITVVPLEKVAYIEELDDEALDSGPPRREPLPSQEKKPEVSSAAPLPVGSSPPVAAPPTLAPTFAAAVQDKLKHAPPPEPVDDSPSRDRDCQIIVELSGSASGSYIVLSNQENFAADHVKEGLVSDIFSNPDLKDGLKSHNVVGIIKSGNLVTLDCRNKPPVHSQTPVAAMTSLITNIAGLVSPVTKLPDLPMQGLKVEDSKE